VDLHWGNDDFLKKIAQPLINKEVAIVLDGLVVSTPVINRGITGRDVEITGAISRAEAINVAASIMGIAPSQVRIDTSG
jgi:preprotein translocase subunit SecD